MSIFSDSIQFGLSPAWKSPEQSEIAFANELISLFPDLSLTQKSDNYSTLTGPKSYDICRFRFTSRSRWISIYMNPEMQKKYSNELLFAAQKNKAQFFWKVNILTVEDVDKVLPFIKESIDWLNCH